MFLGQLVEENKLSQNEAPKANVSFVVWVDVGQKALAVLSGRYSKQGNCRPVLAHVRSLPLTALLHVFIAGVYYVYVYIYIYIYMHTYFLRICIATVHCTSLSHMCAAYLHYLCVFPIFIAHRHCTCFVDA